jgi:ComF family protein
MNLKSFLYSLSDFFFPPQCLLCNTFFTPEKSRYFCNKCYDDFSFVKSPVCEKCGLPFQTQTGEDHLCGQCITGKHFFDKARSISTYDGTLRKAFHGFKYNEKSLLSKPLSQILAAYGGNLLNQKEYDAIVPVPLHSKRLRQRGYNQALILARTAGKAWGIKVDIKSLKRVKWTTPQTVLSKNERQKSIRGSFNCSPERVRGKNLLIIDDIYTSGSTVSECARILKKNGALKVDVLTFARTI